MQHPVVPASQMFCSLGRLEATLQLRGIRKGLDSASLGES